MALLAFDIGGTAVKYGVWENDRLVETAKFNTPDTWDEMKRQLKNTAESMKTKYHLEGAAFSVPGAVNKDEGIIQGISAVPYIHHFPISHSLSELLQLPVCMENDANCAALAELWSGAASDCKNVVFVVIGTGIGGAVIVNGELQRGEHLYGGEFGLMVLEQGKSFSELGTAVNMAKRFSAKVGKEYSGEQVFQLAEAGDEAAQEEVNMFYHYLTLGLYNLQFIFDPEKIILGGGVTAKEGLVDEINQRMKQLLDKNKLNDFVPVVEVCRYKNDANLIGAVANFCLV